jgi:hypothetical protein
MPIRGLQHEARHLESVNRTHAVTTPTGVAARCSTVRWLIPALIPFAQFSALSSSSALPATPSETVPALASSTRNESPTAVEPMLAVANDDSLDDDVRVRAIEQMANPQIADRFLAHPNERPRAAAARRTSRRHALVQAAFDDPDSNVREAATARLDDG